MSDPSSALVVPVPTAPIPPIADFVLHFPDLLSPSAWLLWVIEQVCGENPVDWVTEHFSGDWERMSSAADALENLATYHERYAAEISAAQSTFERGWEGEAASAASSYFTGLAADVAAQAGTLRAMANDIDAVAYGMASTQEALGSAIGMLLDYALVAAASAAAAAASSWTVVGGIIGGAGTAFAISQSARAWLTAVEVHGSVVIAVDALVGVTAGYLSTVHGFTQHPLPAGAYDNTQVTR